MEEGKLISIGTVARLSGVSIKALRYYDRLGILKPASVNAQTGYRYYTFSQLSVIDAIKICMELDIPLKEFNRFMDREGGRIHYERLLDYGRQIAEKKKQIIEEGLAFIDEAQREIDRSRCYSRPGQTIQSRLPERSWFLGAYEEKSSREKDDNRFTRLMLEAVKEGFSIGYEIGFMHRYHQGAVEAYLFVDVQGGREHSCERLFTVPEGSYLCKQTSYRSIQRAEEEFPEIQWNTYEGIVVETELFTGEFDLKQPIYELQCLLCKE